MHYETLVADKSIKKPDKADIFAVAKAAKTSPSTVSRSFNHPELVKASTRRRIDEAVRSLGYLRNRAAQTIHGIRSGTIGLVVPTIDHMIFAEVIQAFSDTVDAAGFTILLATHGYDLEREYTVLRKLMEHRVDGIALIGLDHSEETFRLIERQHIPAVLIWSHSPQSRLPCIGTDNYAAGQMISEHVLSLGHERIALLFPPLKGNDRATARMAGVVQTLEQAGVFVAQSRRIETPYSIADAKTAVTGLLREALPPTAIICGNDVLAWGAVYAANGVGVAVPSALTITGIGDFKGSRDLEPALTTIRLPARQIGRIAGEALSRAITHPTDTITNANISVELIVRETSAQTCAPG